jgi:hypothetical protein
MFLTVFSPSLPKPGTLLKTASFVTSMAILVPDLEGTEGTLPECCHLSIFSSLGTT